MTKKNKLEKKFSKSLKANDKLWGMKLHNNMLAHQTTPADYMITYEFSNSNFENQLTAILVECKQVTLKEGKGCLAFKRLKQMHDLIAFEQKFIAHHSFFCIGFLENRWENSEVYLIPAKIMQHFIENSSKVSVNRQEMFKYFYFYKIDYSNQILNLNALWRN